MFRRNKAVREVIRLPLSTMEMREVERIFARLFSSEEGQKALGYLQLTTYHRVLGKSASDSDLRYMEGQRGLVAKIERLIHAGRRG